MYGLPSSGSPKLGHGAMLAGSYIEAYGSGTTFGRCGSSVSQRRKNGRSPELAFSRRRISSLAPQASRDWSGVISASTSPQKPFVRGAGPSPCAFRHAL